MIPAFAPNTNAGSTSTHKTIKRGLKNWQLFSNQHANVLFTRVLKQFSLNILSRYSKSHNSTLSCTCCFTCHFIYLVSVGTWGVAIPINPSVCEEVLSKRHKPSAGCSVLKHAVYLKIKMSIYLEKPFPFRVNILYLNLDS